MNKLNEELARKMIVSLDLLQEQSEVLSEMINSESNESDELIELMLLSSLIEECNNNWNQLFQDFFKDVCNQKENISFPSKDM